MHKQQDRDRHLKMAQDLCEALGALWAKRSNQLLRRSARLLDQQGSAPRVIARGWNKNRDGLVETEIVFEIGTDEGTDHVIPWAWTDTGPLILNFLPIDEQWIEKVVLYADGLMNKWNEQRIYDVGVASEGNPEWPTTVHPDFPRFFGFDTTPIPGIRSAAGDQRAIHPAT